jgi:hypothetical protein
MTTTLPYNDSPHGFGSVTTHFLPNSVAPSFQNTMIVYALCAGAMALEILGNLSRDWRLLRSSNWKVFTKCSNRIAYLSSRWSSIVFLSLALVYITRVDLDCQAFALTLNILCIIPFISVDFVFMQRTLALYGWNRPLTVLLCTLYLADVGLAVSSITFIGYGYKIPHSRFCAYRTESRTRVYGALFIAYCAVLMFLNTLVSRSSSGFTQCRQTADPRLFPGSRPDLPSTDGEWIVRSN